MKDFIKKQQELADKELRELADYLGCNEQELVNEGTKLFTQIIHNTGEELMRRVVGERVPVNADDLAVNNIAELQKEAGNQALDTIKQHITSVTGVE